MKDEVEKILTAGISLDGTVSALLSLFHKAQVEAVRAARIDELTRSVNNIGFNERVRKYCLDRTANLKDGETK